MCRIVLFACRLVAIITVVGLLSPATRAADPPTRRGADHLVIHEWGTFTCLQNETGLAISGINTDDEPVPGFVHRIADLIPRPTELAPVFYKGVPRTHRQVQMRLETPVVYFYPPAGSKQPLQASLEVAFEGGWLTEYIPAAEVSAPGLDAGNFRFSGLTPKTRGTLKWTDLTIGGPGELPRTDAPVWLSPREVQAATVTTPAGESEKYLFYRGVGNIPSPITVRRNPTNDGLLIQEDVPSHLGLRAPLSIRAFWLVHVRQDGKVAYRSFPAAALTGESGRTLIRTPLNLSGKHERDLSVGAYNTENLARLRAEMRKVLLADGLFADEADAMLKTWELAYFKSAGLRVFYVLPQQWTDAVLPLKCSLVADVSRTMIGRIELVTPQQRENLKTISQSKISANTWLYEQTGGRGERQEELARLFEGKARLDELNFVVPGDYQAFVNLGRFRNALVLDDATRNPDSAVDKFAKAYGLDYYEGDEAPETTQATGK